MTNNKQEKFLKSLIDLTEQGLLDWFKLRNYLDTEYNRILENFLVKRIQYNYEHNKEPEMDVDRSYTAYIEGSYIYIFYFRSYPQGYFSLYIQNDNTTDINELKLSSFTLFNELIDNIKDNLDNIDRTIDKVINIADARLGS